jgi:hypothetical protein
VEWPPTPAALRGRRWRPEDENVQHGSRLGPTRFRAVGRSATPAPESSGPATSPGRTSTSSGRWRRRWRPTRSGPVRVPRAPVRALKASERPPITQRVSLAPGQKRAVRREVRDLVFRCATATGGMLGILWALNRPEQDAPAACGRDDPAHGIAACVNEAFLAALMPYLVGLVAGALGGATLAALVARLLLPRDGRPAPPRTAGERWITARYPGRCDSCPTRIVPGDRILHRPGRALCGTCGRRTAAS